MNPQQTNYNRIAAAIHHAKFQDQPNLDIVAAKSES
jgi:hypothetical protein